MVRHELRLPDELSKRLKKLADESEMSVTSHVRIALSRYVLQQQQERDFIKTLDQAAH